MKFTKSRLVHWIAAAAIAMSALAPALSQAVSLVKGGHGFAMEICSVDGSKMQIDIQGEDQDLANQTQPCPYCVTHSVITPVFNNHLTFEAPQTLALLPQLFYQSPKRFNVWVIPPSAAPPVQA
ncbi:DUF2946 family protein [Polynucleobacter sp. UK-Kesae-W10]|uniref:DUF2946 family protein n=1 Tax=Polynucleobacter sp. UK-Kesae-W10 TaxID=1819738 RepID=UPI001C0D7D22|nr:DUF2946 family protein [Polynucleobacter sp. UK-Kesae-W10]MBU3577750.1 DUF2946 family protein [Polynucleobacter sp. UK-Kesae-W10]